MASTEPQSPAAGAEPRQPSDVKDEAPVAATATESYFDMQPARRMPTAPMSNGLSHHMPIPRRVQTAPDSKFIRPTLSAGTSLLNSFRGNGPTTDLGGSGAKNEPFSYTFDPMSSESEDSTDEEQPVTKSHHEARPKPRTAMTETTHAQHKKEQARKGRSYSRFCIGNDYMQTRGRVSKRDGRLNISINETTHNGYIAKTLGKSIKNHLEIPHKRKGLHFCEDPAESAATQDAEIIASTLRTALPRPRLNIVIMVIGSRGDIQPFLKVGKILQHDHGHRVRIASHPVFRDFVENDAGLEFFSVGGDPSELMAFMVKNPGLIPNMQTIRDGEIIRRRNAMAVMFEGFWRACINTTDDEEDVTNSKMMGDKSPFVADAIIANPPSMAHVHIAEKLGIPLHMMFTFPYSPTQKFPHPLANINPGKSNVDANYVNFMSYPMVEMMTWQGLGDIVNRFRERTLGLEPVSSLWAPGALYRMRVPYTYMWSPSLVAKPKDWGPEIDIAGFVFLDLASNFKPPKELDDFLNAGDPPVYIGFGSIVVDDPDAFTEMIFKATKLAGVRALVNKGWGGLGRGNDDTPDHIFMLDNTPHDWLFPRVQAVIHHGGAGTTAIGLKCAKPTMIVPFFGDQPFWGAMVAEAKAGAHQCIPFKDLSVENLAEGIKQCLTDEAQQNVQKIADSIASEGDGAENAVKSFHRSLALSGPQSIRCSILEDRVSVWQLRHSTMRLSALAATILEQKGKLKLHELKLIRHNEWNDFDGPGEPITGGLGAVKDSLYEMGEGVGMVPVRIAKHMKKREEHERKKREREQRREQRREAKRLKKHPTASTGKDKSLSNDASESHDNVAPDDDEEDRTPAQRTETNMTMESMASADSVPMVRRVAAEVGRGMEQTGWAIVTMPNDLHVAIARGFHNAPRLWGDSTVRKPVRVTGFKSGCYAAGREFVLELWDGWTGIVMQPVGDWRDGVTIPQKVAGLGKGIGKGIGGAVIKTVSAAVAPPAYFAQGMIRYTEKKMRGPSTKSFIRKAHILQGSKDLLALQMQKDPTQLQQIEQQVLDGWHVYEEIWDIANKEFGEASKNLVSHLRFSREKHRWQTAGILENVSTARQALQAFKEGHDRNTILKKCREELQRHDQSRAGVMDEPESPHDEYPAPLAMSVNGQALTSSYANAQLEAVKTRSNPHKAMRRIEDEANSTDSTAVDHSDDDQRRESDSKGRTNSVPMSSMPDKGDLVNESCGKGRMQVNLPSKGVPKAMDQMLVGTPGAGAVGA